MISSGWRYYQTTQKIKKYDIDAQLVSDHASASCASSFLSYFLPSKFLISNSYNSESMLFWPYVVKAKMNLRGGSFFRKIFNKQLKNVNKYLKIEKTANSQTYFDFANIGSEMHSFRGTAI